MSTYLHFNEIVLLSSSLLVAFSAGASLLSGRLRRIKIAGAEIELSPRATVGPAAEPEDKPRFCLAKTQVVRRLDEARGIQSKKRNSSHAFGLAAWSLTIAQYGVGAVLANSFFRQTFSASVIGWCGLIVVIASAMTQHLRPEVGSQAAAIKADQIEGLIRQSEDRMVVIEAKTGSEDDPEAMLELLERITSQLNSITAETGTGPKGEAGGY